MRLLKCQLELRRRRSCVWILPGVVLLSYLSLLAPSMLVTLARSTVMGTHDLSDGCDPVVCSICSADWRLMVKLHPEVSFSCSMHYAKA